MGCYIDKHGNYYEGNALPFATEVRRRPYTAAMPAATCYGVKNEQR